ncbi:putative bifunctional diguanylate cyclase/phosphodiesterase [Photobacterium galatheae]|nr:GGDEF domain-containing phosphodiesterase [Photobacterium galatheae]MCM0148993.1 EAL domain-containing protein [Photobacterium galatheae]
MRRSHEILRIGLASASLGTIGYPVVNGVITGSLLLSFLLPSEVKRHDDIDSVTGLLNLKAYKKNMNEVVIREINLPNNHKRIFIASIDILEFSEINKNMGYTIGRRVLRGVSRIIKQQSKCLASARPYGDIFLLTYAADSVEDVMQDLHSIIEKSESMKDPLGFSLSLCSGISELQIANEEGVEVDIISSAITQAEIARLIGKRGATKINCYKSEYASKQLEKIKMEDALLKSIDNHEISVFYQPKLTATTREIIGFEALCRWYHKELGFISPAFFIPLSEETGFIHRLGRHVIEESCKTLKWLEKNGHRNISFAVNVSIAQLEHLDGKPLISHIRNMIQEYEITPSLLEIEITESMAAKDFNLIKQHVNTLRELGVVVSLDDFGTGESTLYRLKELNLNQLKIDKAFVDDVCNERGKEVMQGIFTIAKAMNLTTVAEGVENAKQAEILEEMGCTYLQGYHLGKPMPKEHVLDAIKINKGA